MDQGQNVNFERSEIIPAIMLRLSELDFYKYFNASQRMKIAVRLSKCEESLMTNLIEWISCEEFSDIWINNKYCLRLVMQIRKSDDFIPAFLSLDNYAKDPDTEFNIWIARC